MPKPKKKTETNKVQENHKLFQSVQLPKEEISYIENILENKYKIENLFSPKIPDTTIKKILGKTKEEMWNLDLNNSKVQYEKITFLDEYVKIMSKQEKNRVKKMIKDSKLYFGFFSKTKNIFYEIIVYNKDVYIAIPVVDNQKIMKNIKEIVN